MKRRSLLKPPSTGSASTPRPTAACPRLGKPSPISPAQKISISRTLPKRFSTGAWIEESNSQSPSTSQAALSLLRTVPTPNKHRSQKQVAILSLRSYPQTPEHNANPRPNHSRDIPWQVLSCQRRIRSGGDAKPSSRKRNIVAFIP